MDDQKYVTRDDCPRDPCQWPMAHNHKAVDHRSLLSQSRPEWVKRAEANRLDPKELAR